MVPWDLVISNPSYAFILPFLWVLWQIYCPRFVNRLFGRPPTDDFLYQTWWSRLKEDFKSEFDRVDTRVQSIEHTQERLVDITIAQTHMMNGHDGEMKVEEVERDLRKHPEKSPSDYMDDDYYDDSKGSSHRSSESRTNDYDDSKQKSGAD